MKRTLKFSAIGLGAVVILAVYLMIDGNRVPSVTIPMPKMPKVNARDYFIRAVALLVEPRNPDDLYGGPTIPLERKRQLVRINTAAICEVRRGLRFPFREIPVRDFESSLEHLDTFRHVSALLATDAEVKIAQANYSGALDACLDNLNLSTSILNGGVYVHLRIALWIEGYATRNLRSIIPKLSRSEAIAAQHNVENLIAACPSFLDLTREEKWSKQASLIELFQHPDWHERLTRYTHYPPAWIDQGYVLALGKRRIFDHYTNYMNAVERTARVPFAQVAGLPRPPDDPICRQLIWSGTAGMCRDMHFDYTLLATENLMLVVALGLRAFYCDHNQYPSDLSELSPTWLSKVPNDLFAMSGPIKYRRTKTGYLLYSVGPDGQDDGGKPIPAKGLNALSRGDFIPTWMPQ